MRNEETRVFVVDLVDSEVNSAKLDPESECFDEEVFMQEASDQNGVYTIKEFQKMLNNGCYLESCIVYFKDMKWQDFDMYRE